MEVDALEEGAAPAHLISPAHSIAEKLTTKAQKITIKLPWEITTIYSEVLKNSGHQSDDEEDEDDLEAHEASIQRLKVLAHFSSFRTTHVLSRKPTMPLDK